MQSQGRPIVPLRIYADFNGIVHGPDGSKRLAVVLDTFGSVRDLANAGCRLQPGMPLIAWDASDEEEDLEASGTAEYDPLNKWWVLQFDEQGIRYVPARDRDQGPTCHCVSCGISLDRHIAIHGYSADVLCPACGTSVYAPIAPPSS